MTDKKQTQNKGGRPGVPQHDGTEEGKALAKLQYTANLADRNIVHHDRTSLVARAGRCARAGVPIEKPLAAVQALRAALDEAEDGIQAAYAAPKDTPAKQERINLLD